MIRSRQADFLCLVPKTHTNHGIADKYSMAVTYKLKMLYLALAENHNVQNTNITRAVGQYGIGPVTLGALWQKADRIGKLMLSQ